MTEYLGEFRVLCREPSHAEADQLVGLFHLTDAGLVSPFLSFTGERVDLVPTISVDLDANDAVVDLGDDRALRTRYQLTCDYCGLNVPAMHWKLQRLARQAIAAGVSVVTLRALPSLLTSAARSESTT